MQVPQILWGQLAPIIVVLGAAVLGVLVEAFMPARSRRLIQIVLAMFATLIAGVWALALGLKAVDEGGQAAVGSNVITDPMALFMQMTLAFAAFVAILVIADRTGGEDAFAPQAAAAPGSEYEEQVRAKGLVQTEAYPLVLFATGGMMIFPSAGDLLTLFVALEVLSLPLYLLSGMARRRRLLSQEAALKYFLLGAFASAFLLFGIAFIYGYAGTVTYSGIFKAIESGPLGMDFFLLAGLVLLLVGLLFKVGAVPFHSWTPDVYQGAPTPITGFMAACTKVAAFGALLRVVYVLLVNLRWDIRPMLWVVAIATMIVGTVVGLVQQNIKRMLAYSAIAHTGFILAGLVSFQTDGISSVLFYMFSYAFTTIGAFAVVSLVREQDAEGNITAEAGNINQWKGLGKRSPLLAGVFSFFLLAFAGIPLTSGFIGKFAVFSAAVEGGAWPLALAGVLCSAAAAFFYARVIVMMFFSEPESDSAVVVTSEGLTVVAIGIAFVITLALGIFPSPLLGFAQDAASLLLG